MGIEYLINKLQEELKLSEMSSKDEKGNFQLVVHTTTTTIISMTELNPGIFFSTNMMTLPQEKNKEGFYIYLMTANLLGQGTGGGAIGIDASEKYLTFTHTIPFTVDYSLFYDVIEDFINYVDYWKQEIPKYFKNK